jgi:hypothetical protein
MNTEGVKSTVSFKEPKEWVLNEKTILVTKIETTTHEWTAKVSKEKEVETLDPIKTLYNLVKNIGLMPNGSFFEVDNHRILARINDISGTTLIRTQWYIPIDEFNQVATYHCVVGGIKEEKFHIISKIS